MRRALRQRTLRGQSTVEFALMMPIIMAFFFYVFEANIYWSALHQSAWAAYAAARTNLVLGGPAPKGRAVDRTGKMILTGRLFEQGVNISPSTLRPGGGPDGVIVRLQGLDSLPYTKDLLSFNSEVSTHLGWQEYDKMRYPDPYEWESHPLGAKMVTDNNLKDY